MGLQQVGNQISLPVVAHAAQLALRSETEALDGTQTAFRNIALSKDLSPGGVNITGL